MKKITYLVKALRLKGAPISRRVITSITRGVVVANDRSILVENGGYLSINSDFGRNVLYRMEKDGNKMVQRKGTTTKIPVAPGILREIKQITGTFAVSKYGLFLPMQIIYEGKTTRCLPKNVEFPEGFNVTFTPNHWSNEEKVIEYLNEIISPYCKAKREELDLPLIKKHR